MPLVTTGEPGISEHLDVAFVMLKDDHRVSCHASAEAIETLAHSASIGPAERLRIFDQNRATFEIIASRLWNAGFQPRVKAGDLPR